MYLEKFKDRDVIVTVMLEELNNYKNFETSYVYLLTKLAEYLRAKSITINGDTKDSYEISVSCQQYGRNVDSKLTIQVSYCDTNRCLFVDEVYEDSKLIGFYKSCESNSVEPNEILTGEKNIVFDIKLSNYDFTVDNKNGFDYLEYEENGALKLKRVDK